MTETIPILPRRTRSAYDELVCDDRVHSRIYTDPEIFEEELDRVFHRGWVYVGHEGEVPEPGDFRSTLVGRQPVILVRGDDGTVRVLMNRCTHRGTVVCPHERGNAARFTCVYHAWSFRNTGELAAVPYDERYDETFDRSQLGLRPAPRVGTYRGFVFASLAQRGQPFDDYLVPGVRRQLDLATDISPSLRLSLAAGVHKYAFDGNWKLQAENNVDAYHFNFVHRSFWQVVQGRRGTFANGTSAARVRSLGNGHVDWDYRPLRRDLGDRALDDDPALPPWQRDYVRSLVELHGPERTAELLGAGQAHVFVFPNLALIQHQIRVMFPTRVDHTDLTVAPTLLVGAPDEVNAQRIRAHESFYGPAGGGATDDFEVFARQALGLRAEVDPWLLLARGRGREEVDADGHVTGQVTDELGSRAILQHWRSVMVAGGTR
jgi:phenylpropionate dioxygenase-like ring-hydroxylating dioxygenase large terminal subunit